MFVALFKLFERSKVAIVMGHGAPVEQQMRQSRPFLHVFGLGPNLRNYLFWTVINIEYVHVYIYIYHIYQ